MCGDATILFPLLVSVTADEVQALASWRESAFPIAAGAVIVCIFLTLASSLLVREVKREETLSGSLHPDEVGEITGFEPPEGEYETLAGFVLDRLGRIPDVGDGFAFDGWRLEVAEMDGLRVATVTIERSDP